MADLLECLIQIRALGETLERVSRLAGGTGRRAFWERMAESERRYAGALGVEAAARPEVAAKDAMANSAQDEFVTLRRKNLALLGRSSAAQLAGIVEWPGRPSTTVADLVAIMLANDTEVLGDLRRAVPSPQPR